MQSSFRLGRWGSSILPLGPRQCYSIARTGLIYDARLYATTSPSSENGKPTSPRRGRPRKGEVRVPKAIKQSAETSQSHDATTVRIPEEGNEAEPSGMDDVPFSETAADNEGVYPNTSEAQEPTPPNKISPGQLPSLPSPPPELAKSSAKLAALRARLALPSSVPLETLARCLVDKSADPDPRFNNHHLSNMGNDLLGYYIGEHLICHYPRLPIVVLHAAIQAHVGPKALQALAHGWGVEVAAEPGGEVDPGLLQFRRELPKRKDVAIAKSLHMQAQERAGTYTPIKRTLEVASSFFCRAVVATVYLHGGAERVKDFIHAHFLSRHLDLSSLFTFTAPTRDLSRLCAREGFESPVARVISETGRLSRHPVFVVGVFSGRDMLGQDAGASLNEARFKAAAKALKGWYLYSPRNAIGGGEIMVPSMMEGAAGRGRVWRKPHIDDGEVIT